MKNRTILYVGVFLVVLFWIFAGCNKTDSRRSETNEPEKQIDTLETAWRKNTNKVMKECDSILVLYGDIYGYEKKKQMMKDKIPGDYNGNNLEQERNAKDAFLYYQKTLSSLKRELSGKMPKPIHFFSLSPGGDHEWEAASWKDTLYSEIDDYASRMNYYLEVSTKYYIWLNTCKAADFLDSVVDLVRKNTVVPSAPFYDSLKNRLHEVVAIFPQLKQLKKGIPEHGNESPYYRTATLNLWSELEKITAAMDNSVDMMHQLDSLYKKSNYSEMVDLLRSKDSPVRGAVIRHTRGFLFYVYKVIDSLILNRYEAELQKMVAGNRSVSIDSLLLQLESDTRFLFPHHAVRRKREIRRALELQGHVAPVKKAEPKTAPEKKSAGTPVFSCFYSSTFNESDERPKEDTTVKWLCLAPKQNHYGREQVMEATFSARDYFKVNPEELMDDYTEGNRIAYLDGKELPADNENPYLFFVNVEGVRPGPVEKADVYDIGDRYIALIENDSIEFVFNAEGHLEFIDATVNDRMLNERFIYCSYYILWIGDVNRNGRIDFVVETFGSQMGNMFHFLEKRNDNGRTVLETVMSHSIYSAD